VLSLRDALADISQQALAGAGDPDRSGRSRFNHDVAIVERCSFDRAKSNLVEEDAVLGDAALLSGVDREFRFNFMDYEARGSGINFVENLVTLLVDVASTPMRSKRRLAAR
jgi:hypothetical protein